MEIKKYLEITKNIFTKTNECSYNMKRKYTIVYVYFKNAIV